MKKRSRRKYTLVVIPDANRSVVRLQVPGFLLVAIPVAAALLLAAALLFYILFVDHASAVDRLQQELAAASEEYERRLAGKDDDIAALQSDVIGLSEQAREIEERMEEIRALEAQVKELAGLDSGDGATALQSLETSGGGQGGAELPIPEGTDGAPIASGRMSSIVDRTRENYESLGELIERMKPQLEETKQAIAKQQQILRVTPTIWPTSSRKVTSLFGVRKDPFTRRSTFHAGLDISGDIGDPVYAAADGKVVLSERDGTHGHNILIDHGRGVRTRYLHLSKRIAEVGDKVVKGELIGELGNTGRSTGPHLHYEVIVNGENVDPRPYLNTARKEP